MLIVKKSSLPNSGKGLFTTLDIKKGQIVCEYEGEMITWDEATKRNSEDVKKGAYFYFINDKKVIDAFAAKNTFGRFANDAKPDVAIVVFGEDPYAEFVGDRAHLAFDYGRGLQILTELKAQGIAVNTLWPQTIIATSALNVASVGLGEMGRKPAIMADAAWHVLTADARALTGRSLIDEAVLREAGVTDFSGYLVTPGVSPIVDLFLDPPSTPA